ncbi:LysR family transcriptional regulator [Roseovarius sp. SCSIO 43702]|uniref:LysR family transcriptional regulator n=1 Tax=Roseovarius sp. SCSIO 43702 TaxID=2823043 RepID=UPI001C736174|nr:LysR family transcriptional regulator [Roseovarius sp. SCSIO 43702]QYX58129.1 LysR family transcriptional regulator [Roseovarius sp. SCSIO 43702]
MSLDLDTKFAFRLDWNLLRTFLVISEEGSITRAAHRLLRGQPSVSLALKRLESELGCRLVDRGHGGFRLTAAGRQLQRECTELFSGVARIPEVTQEASTEISGEVNIMLASHVVTPLLDNELSALSAAHPKMRFTIRIDTSARVIHAVRERMVSFGICLVNRRFSDVDYTQMYREFFGFYCGPSHPLFGRSNLSFADLRNFPAVSFDTDDLSDALRPVALLRGEWGLDYEIVGRSSQLEEVRRMIQCGMGIGSLPIHVVEPDVERGLLWRLPPYENPPQVDIYLVSNPKKRLNKAEALFLERLSARIARTPLDERTYLSGPPPASSSGAP